MFVSHHQQNTRIMPLKLTLQDADNKGVSTNKGLTTSTRVSLNKFKYAVQCFKDNFSLNPTTPAGWDAYRIINWASMESMVGGALYDPTAMITVSLGLKGTDLIYGFGVVKVDPANKIVPPLDADSGYKPTHELRGNVITLLTDTERDNWPGYQNAYYASVMVRRNGVPGTGVLVNKTDDPKAITFGWLSELFAMKDTNQRRYPTEPMALVMNNYAVFHVDDDQRAFNGEDGFRHGLCFHTCILKGDGSFDRDLLDNKSYILPYTHRGSNLGHLCPPRCKQIDALGSL